MNTIFYICICAIVFVLMIPLSIRLMERIFFAASIGGIICALWYILNQYGGTS